MANWHTIDELHDISADLPRFIQAFTELATRLGLDIAPLEADHISLRCHQNATAERWRRGFEQCGELLSENIINGRPICLFKLHAPVTVAHWQFTVVELPSPERSVIRTKAGSISKLFCPGARDAERPCAGAAFRRGVKPAGYFRQKPARQKGSANAYRTLRLP